GRPRRPRCARARAAARSPVRRAAARTPSLLLQPRHSRLPTGRALPAVTEQRLVLHRAPRVDADATDARGRQLLPQPGAQVEARGATPARRLAARQMLVDVLG